MRVLLPLLAGVLLVAAPLSARADADTLLRTAFENRYGAALGEGELHLRLQNQVTADVDAVEALNFDPKSGRFAAILRGKGDRVRVDGEIWTEIPLPVPTRRLSPGDVIAEEDITLIPVRTAQVGARSVTDKESLVGMEVKRVLTAGRPIQSNSVTTPIVVHRNKPVTVQYRQGSLLVTAQGRALEDAATGSLVRVQNVDSNRTLTATAIGPGLVSASD